MNDLLSFSPPAPALHAVANFAAPWRSGATSASARAGLGRRPRREVLCHPQRLLPPGLPGPPWDFTGFMISASHSDSPTFRVKENAELSGPDRYIRVNTEGLRRDALRPMADRPLTVAGRVLVRAGDAIETRLVYVTGTCC